MNMEGNGRGRFDRDGFMVFEKVISADKCDQLAVSLADLFQSKQSSSKSRIGGVRNLLQTSPLVAEIANGEAMVGMLNMSMDVKVDGTLVFRMTGTEEKGTWKQEGDKFTATTKKGDKDEVHTGTVDGDQIRFAETTGPKPMTIVLAKKK